MKKTLRFLLRSPLRIRAFLGFLLLFWSLGLFSEGLRAQNTEKAEEKPLTPPLLDIRLPVSAEADSRWLVRNDSLFFFSYFEKDAAAEADVFFVFSEVQKKQFRTLCVYASGLKNAAYKGHTGPYCHELHVRGQVGTIPIKWRFYDFYSKKVDVLFSFLNAFFEKPEQRIPFPKQPAER
jgi:hypothetical protein